MTRDFFGLLIVLTLIGGFVLLYPSIRYDPPIATAPPPPPDKAAQLLAEAQSARPDRASVAPVGVQRQRQAEAPDPTDIIMAPETGIGLGWGWNEFHGEAIPTQCVEFVRAQPFDGQTSSLDFSEVNDQFELQSALDMSAAASVKTAGYQVEGEAKFSSETKISGSALTYVIEAEVLNAPWIAQPTGDGGGQAVRLTPAAERLTQRDLELFKDVCGTGYISATYGGAKLSIVVEITTYSQSTREAMSAAVKGGGWGVKVEAAMSGGTSSGSEKASREINFFQTGGKPRVLPTTPAAIIEAAETLAVQADEAEKIFRIAVTPYEVLRNWPREDNLSGSDLEYEELAALWGSYQSLYHGLQDALDAPDAHVLPVASCAASSCAIESKDANTDDVKAEIKAMQDEVIIWLDRLELAARACVTAEESCETNTALYRTPYAYNVAMPVRTCLLDDKFDPSELAAYEAAYDLFTKSLFWLGTNDSSDNPQLSIENVFPGIHLECKPSDNSNNKSTDDLDFYARMMIEDTAKSRCALSTLTPGCLTNGDIAEWTKRIGQRAVILTSPEAVGDLKQKVISHMNSDGTNWPTECGHLAERKNWITGDPGTSLTTSVWVPPQCEKNVRMIAAAL